jgi:phosphotransferase system enzyme I (PtsI)
MRRFSGIAASEGIAIGRAQLLASHLSVPNRWISSAEVGDEVGRLERAVAATDQRLAETLRDWKQRPGDETPAIVDVERSILKSDELIGAAAALIRDEQLAAEPAVRRVVEAIVATFEKMDNGYFRERGADFEAVGQRLLGTLMGIDHRALDRLDLENKVGVGTALFPVDAHRMHAAGLAGVVTERGGKTSHLAIILRALELPYVAGVAGLLRALRPGALVMVDGERGDVIVDPDRATLQTFEERQARRVERAQRLRPTVARPCRTEDGTRVEIAANIEVLAEIAPALDRGAESIGLFRTEFLYLHRPDLPTEEEQYQDATAAIRALAGRTATFRTLDLGGDKLPLAVEIPGGPNPGLGMRSIRLSIRRPDIFRTQLRALYRASVVGPIRIMFPLVSTVGELEVAQQTCAEVRAELASEGVPLGAPVPIGVMIETPSAALTVDHLAAACDFFSIGTNDLIQYTFAADRENEEVDYLHDPLQPAVLRLLALAIEAAARAGKPISVCGDMAGDPLCAWLLLGLGIRELSMAPSQIAFLKSIVKSTRLGEAQAVTATALALSDAGQIRALVMREMAGRFPMEMGSHAGGEARA